MISERRITSARKYLSKCHTQAIMLKYCNDNPGIIFNVFFIFGIRFLERKTIACRKLLSRNATNQLIENIIHEMYEVNFERYQDLLLYRWKKSQKK